MRKVSVPLIESVPEYEMRGDVVHIIVDGIDIIATPITTFRAALDRQFQLLIEYEERTFPRETEQRAALH